MTTETLDKANELNSRISILSAQLDELKKDKNVILYKLSAYSCEKVLPEEYHTIEKKVKNFAIDVVSKELAMYKREFSRL